MMMILFIVQFSLTRQCYFDDDDDGDDDDDDDDDEYPPYCAVQPDTLGNRLSRVTRGMVKNKLVSRVSSSFSQADRKGETDQWTGAHANGNTIRLG